MKTHALIGTLATGLVMSSFTHTTLGGLVTTNLVQNLDASSGINLGTGTNVDSWDHTIAGETVTANDGANRATLNVGALNGNDTLSFQDDRYVGTSTSLYAFGTGGFTWWSVANVSSSTGNRTNVFGTLFTGGFYDGIQFETNGGVLGNVVRAASAETQANETSFSGNTWRIYAGRRLGDGTLEFWVDGVLAGTASNGGDVNAAQLTVGAERPGGGEHGIFDLAHLSFYNTNQAGDASTGDFAEMGYYLEQRYGLDTAFVPEPSSLALLGLGGLLIARRRRSN